MTLKVSTHGRVLLLEIDRPAARNAINRALADALNAALAELERADELSVAIVTGADDVAFCSGTDLSQDQPVEHGQDPNRYDGGIVNSFRCSKPLIAAVNGYAVGGGLELAMTCDIRIAASNASFGLPEVRIGSMPGGGGTQRLPLNVSMSDAMYLALTGNRVTAAEALRMGLVSKVVDPGNLRAEAFEIANRISENAPLAVKAVKRAILEGLGLTLQTGLALERSLFETIRQTRDRAEGRAAFREKRTPQFIGS